MDLIPSKEDREWGESVELHLQTLPSKRRVDFYAMLQAKSNKLADENRLLKQLQAINSIGGG